MNMYKCEYKGTFAADIAYFLSYHKETASGN